MIAPTLPPDDWYRYHASGCGTRYRGCAPDCPKDTWERTGVWIGPVAAALLSPVLPLTPLPQRFVKRGYYMCCVICGMTIDYCTSPGWSGDGQPGAAYR